MTTKTRSHLVRHRAALVLAGLFAGVVLAACGSSSADSGTGNTGPSDAEFTQLKNEVADLKQQVASLTAALETLSGSVNVVVARNGATARTMMKGGGTTTALKLEDAEAIGCTFSGYLPANQLEADTIQCKTPNGYAFNLRWPDGGAPLDVDVFFEASGCVGTPLVGTYMMAKGARIGGAVVTYFDATGSHVGMVEAGAEVVSRNVGSLHNGDACFDLAEFRDGLIEISPHELDPETGVNSTTLGKNTYPPMTVVTQ